LLTIDMSPSNETYYPTVAIACLMRVLFNPSLSTHHSHVIQAVVFMAKSLDKQSIQFLPQIMPAFLHVLSTCEPGFREFILQQLGRLVGVVKQVCFLVFFFLSPQILLLLLFLITCMRISTFETIWTRSLL